MAKHAGVPSGKQWHKVPANRDSNASGTQRNCLQSQAELQANSTIAKQYNIQAGS